MSKSKNQFLAGYITGLILSLVLIHFFLADLFAQILGIPVTAVYWSLMALTIVSGLAYIRRKTQIEERNGNESPSFTDHASKLSYFTLYVFIFIFSVFTLLGVLMLPTNAIIAAKIGLFPFIFLMIFASALAKKNRNKNKKL